MRALQQSVECEYGCCAAPAPALFLPTFSAKEKMTKVVGHHLSVKKTYCDVLVEDIQALMIVVGCGKVAYVPRKANNAALMIAHGIDCISIRHTPGHIATAIATDVME